MSGSGYRDDATEYRINAALNKLRAASDRGDVLAQKLKSYESGATSYLFDEVRKDPALFAFLCKPYILAPARFLYYLAVDTKRVAAGCVARVRSALDPTDAHRNSQPVAASQPSSRFLIDVTGARTGRVGGGIKRVCDRLAATLSETGRAQPCGIHDGKLYAADAHTILEDELSFQANDIYLMVDSFWDPLEEFVAVSQQAKTAGTTTVLCIHDAFPISRPKLVPDGFDHFFQRSCLALAPHLDAVISISRASAAEVEASLKRIGLNMPVEWFALGCDSFDVKNHWAEGTAPAFLSIGTLEPKKGYDVALDAFETLWAEGVQATYTIVGKEGWLCEALVARIVHHPDFGKRLLWRSGVPDQELSRLVAGSYCLVQASLAEGFGLPVAEAAASGLPVIASDLPVFKEICDRNAVFFPVCDSAALATAIRDAIDKRPLPPELNVHSWDASANALLDLVHGISARKALNQSS